MEISEFRKKIDALDAKIVRILNERAEISLAIGQEKAKHKKSVYSPDREKEVLKRIKALSKGPMPSSGLEAVYREIMSSSLSLEKNLKVAYLGPQASFTNLAAVKKFGSQVEYVSCANISEVFQRVDSNDCDYGVVPIENSIEGAVTHTFDLLVDSELKICSQIILEISQNLMAKSPAKNIKQIYSKMEVFGQCRRWLQLNLPHAELIDVSSTAKAAQIVAKRRNAACIASELAAKVYHLDIIKRNIQDAPHNVTRFLVLSNNDVAPTGKDRTSLVCSIKDRVGALHKMLEPFSRNKINLTKIESRPSKRKAWEYYFFIDIEGHRLDPRVQKAFAQLEPICHYVKILGSYPVLE